MREHQRQNPLNYCIHLLNPQHADVLTGSKGKMGHKRPRLLLVGENKTLLRTRELVFTSVGCEAFSLSSLQAFHTNYLDCDLLLICHSVPQETAAALKEKIGLSNSEAKVVRMTYFKDDEPPIYDLIVSLTSGPRDLISHVAELLMPGNTAA